MDAPRHSAMAPHPRKRRERGHNSVEGLLVVTGTRALLGGVIALVHGQLQLGQLPHFGAMLEVVVCGRAFTWLLP